MDLDRDILGERSDYLRGLLSPNWYKPQAVEYAQQGARSFWRLKLQLDGELGMAVLVNCVSPLHF